MKAIKNISLAIIITILTSCSEDESCGLNGKVNGDCFKVVTIEYNVQTYGSDGDTRENLFLEYQFDNGASRYAFVIRSSEFEGNPASNGQADNFLLETGVEYQMSSMSFNGDQNDSATGDLRVTLSKVDRNEGMVSGSFVWKGESTGETTTNLSGTFTNVDVEFEQ